MSESIWVAIILAVSGVVGTLVTKLVSRKPEQANDRDKLIDQLQENQAADRAEFGKLRAADRAELAELRADHEAFKKQTKEDADHDARTIRHLNDEIVELRQDIVDGKVPPLKPRPAWPLRQVTP